MRKARELRVDIDNYQLYLYYYERLINIALAQFEWSGLPDTCDRLYFERMLLYRGCAGMYIPEGTDFWLSTGIIPAMPGRARLSDAQLREFLNIETPMAAKVYEKLFNNPSNFDVYGYPTGILGIGFNGEQIHPEGDNWLMLYDNMTKIPIIDKIRVYATLMYEVHMTMRNNVRQQNTPYIITAPKNKTLSFKQLFKSVFSFEPVVEFNSESFDEELKVLNLKVDYRGAELMDLLKDLWREALNMLGISAQSTKKERLISGEIYMDRQADIIALNARLLNRVDFCNKMNERFGLDMSVNLSSQEVGFDEVFGDLTTNDEGQEKMQPNGGEDNG